MKQEMNRIHSKNHNIGLQRINKISLFSDYYKKYIYLKMDIIGHHFSINLLVKQIKTILSNVYISF